jgi:hypothetical protein
MGAKGRANPVRRQIVERQGVREVFGAEIRGNEAGKKWLITAVRQTTILKY